MTDHLNPDSALADLPTVDGIVREWAASAATTEGATTLNMATLVDRLQDREDAIVVLLHQAGVTFGLFPAIVAEVLADVGLGHAPTTEERALIHSNFHAQMEELRRMMGGQG